MLGLDVRLTSSEGVHSIRVQRAIPPRPGGRVWQAVRGSAQSANTADTAGAATGIGATAISGIVWAVQRGVGWCRYTMSRDDRYYVVHRFEADGSAVPEVTAVEHHGREAAVEAAVVLVDAVEGLRPAE